MTHQVLFVGGRKGPLRSYSQEPKLVQRLAPFVCQPHCGPPWRNTPTAPERGGLTCSQQWKTGNELTFTVKGRLRKLRGSNTWQTTWNFKTRQMHLSWDRKRPKTYFWVRKTGITIVHYLLWILKDVFKRANPKTLCAYLYLLHRVNKLKNYFLSCRASLHMFTALFFVFCIPRNCIIEKSF